jgi:hypothetical protein
MPANSWGEISVSSVGRVEIKVFGNDRIEHQYEFGRRE